MKYHWITVMQDTEHPGITPGCFFPCFLPENPSGVHFVHPCTPHDIINEKMMPPSGRAHPQVYFVSNFGVNRTNSSQDTAIFVSPLS